tara:strand:+ start:249 stop:749 length:501 start_codon:yes stop_codon:yes gene_type:complete
MEIFVTHFNSVTLQENRDWLKNNNFKGCIYGTPIKISESCLPETEIIVIEMNNTKNKIEGLGFINNKLIKEDKKKYKIYTDNNYNRFIYSSNKHITKSEFSKDEEIIIKKLEKLLFKTHNHCKRGQGIQRIPKHINNNQEFDYKKFLNNIYNKYFTLINISNMKIM